MTENTYPSGPVVLGDGTDVTGELAEMRTAAHDAVEAQADVKAAEKKTGLTRRDALHASKLLRRHKMDPQDPVALSIAMDYLGEKKAGGDGFPSFQVWLDEEVTEDDEDGAEDPI